jgi:hypothetical protein
LPAGNLQDLRGVAAHGRREPQPLRELAPEQAVELAPSLLDRTPAQIVALELEEIEDDVDEPSRPAAALLQTLERWDPVLVRRADLAVEDEARRREGPYVARDGGEVSCPVLPAPADETDPAAALDRGDPVPVVLELVEVLGRRVDAIG